MANSGSLSAVEQETKKLKGVPYFLKKRKKSSPSPFLRVPFFTSRPLFYSQGRRPELTRGGLLRSIGGWLALSALRGEAVRVKGDERILGDSDFVEAVLKEADEQLERRHRLKALGFDLEQVAQRVAAVMDIPEELVWEKSRRPRVFKARDLLCYWASIELLMTKTDLSKRLNLTQPAVSIAVRRGEKIAKENQYKLTDS